MSRRDYRHREAKKPKKDTSKAPSVSVMKTPVNVEVIKKGSKKREEEE